MVITTDNAEVEVGGSPMRVLVAAPRGPGRYPGVLCYSDIFQLTGPTVRACARLAGYGFVVAAPEIYHRLEPPGTAIPFDDAGRARGLEDASKTPVSDFDADCRAALDYLASHPRVAAGKLGAAGFCIGGHLAFRAALQGDARARAGDSGRAAPGLRLCRPARARRREREDHGCAARGGRELRREALRGGARLHARRGAALRPRSDRRRLRRDGQALP